MAEPADMRELPGGCDCFCFLGFGFGLYLYPGYFSKCFSLTRFDSSTNTNLSERNNHRFVTNKCIFIENVPLFG